MHPHAELIVLNGPSAGKTFALDGEELRIGRGPGNQLVVNDPQADWKHCAIQCETDGHVLADFGSSHGVFVNGSRVSSQRLKDKDQVSIGDTILVYRRTGTQQQDTDAKATFLRASTMLYFFRLLAQQPVPQIETQLLRLMAGVIPEAAYRLPRYVRRLALMSTSPESREIVSPST